jgi:hypothetical protein
VTGRRLAAAAALVLAVAAAMAVLLAVRILAFPYPVNLDEAFLLEQVVRLAAGDVMFRTSMSEPPFMLTNYTPLFIVTQLPFHAVAGPAYWYGRLISYVGGLTAVACVGLVVYHLTRDRLAAALAGLALMTAPFVVTWSPLARVDGLALGLEWAGLYAIVRSAGTRGTIAGALLIVASAYTKQTNVLAPSVAALMWLLAVNRRRDALVCAATIAGVGAVIFAVLNAVTHGGFLFNIVTGNAQVLRMDRLIGSFVGLAIASPALLAAAGLALVALRGPDARLTAGYLAGALVVALTVAKVGSSFNYFFELLAGSSMAFGLVLARLQYRTVVTLALTGLLVARTGLGLRDGRFGPEPYSRLEHRQAFARLLEMIRANNGDVLADETAGLLPLAGRRIYIEPFNMVQLARAGRWDPSRLVADVESRRFGLILLTRDPGNAQMLEERWNPDVLAAVERTYDRVADVPITDTFVTGVYRPR